MSKGNIHKKSYSIDDFARRYYCQKSRLKQLREDKRRAKKKARSELKRGTSLKEQGNYDE